MRRFEAEPRVTQPPDFDHWLRECGELADSEGQWALIGFWWYAPREYCAYLLTFPGLWDGLLARARYADWHRYEAGVHLGRSLV